MTVISEAPTRLNPLSMWCNVVGRPSVSETGRELVSSLTEPVLAQTGDALVLGRPPTFIDHARLLLRDLVEDGSWDEATLLRLQRALPNATRLVGELADLIGEPDLDADPDGDAALDWLLPDGVRLAASVSETGSVAFVLLSGSVGSLKGTVCSVSRATAAMRSTLAIAGVTKS